MKVLKGEIFSFITEYKIRLPIIAENLFNRIFADIISIMVF